MSQLLVKHRYITQTDLATIVANASFLWERLKTGVLLSRHLA